MQEFLKANGDAVITMDSDLQHPPKYIKILYEKWQEGYKIVECIKNKRQKENMFYKLSANIFYKTLYKLTNVDMANGGDFKIMDRQVVNEVLKLKDTGLFFRGMVNWVGFEKTTIKIDIPNRAGDTSKFNFKSLAKLALNAVTYFSVSPLNIPIQIAIIGLVVRYFFAYKLFFYK